MYVIILNAINCTYKYALSESIHWLFSRLIYCSKLLLLAYELSAVSPMFPIGTPGIQTVDLSWVIAKTHLLADSSILNVIWSYVRSHSFSKNQTLTSSLDMLSLQNEAGKTCFKHSDHGTFSQAEMYFEWKFQEKNLKKKTKTPKWRAPISLKIEDLGIYRR